MPPIATSRSSVSIKTTFGLRDDRESKCRTPHTQLHKLTHISSRQAGKVAAGKALGPILAVLAIFAKRPWTTYDEGFGCGASFSLTAPPGGDASSGTTSRFCQARFCFRASLPRFPVTWARPLRKLESAAPPKQQQQHSTSFETSYYRGHITPLLKSLHRLPVCFRIDYKIILLVFKALNGLSPSYLYIHIYKYVCMYVFSFIHFIIFIYYLICNLFIFYNLFIIYFFIHF